MRRGDDARVRLARLAVADALVGVLLQDPEQLHLEVQREIPDLVQEERPVRRRLEAPHPVAGRPGERAAHVTEQLGLEQLAGKRCGVHGDELSVPARRVRVDHPRGHLLARPALARDEDGRLAVLQGLDEPEHPRHRLRPADDPEPGDRTRRPDRLVVRGPHHDEVARVGIAHAAHVVLERRGGHREQPRDPSGRLQERAPTLALLSGEEGLPQRTARAEELRAEHRLDGLVDHPPSGAGPEERVEPLGDVVDAKPRVEGHADPTEGAERGVHRREGDLTLAHQQRFGCVHLSHLPATFRPRLKQPVAPVETSRRVPFGRSGPNSLISRTFGHPEHEARQTQSSSEGTSRGFTESASGSPTQLEGS